MPLSDTATIEVRTQRPPPWRDVRVLRVVGQLLFVALVALVVLYLYRNLIANLQGRGIRTDFGFLDRQAGFRITGSDFSSRDSVWRAILVGLGNTLAVSLLGIVLATVLGTVIGVARLSTNWLVRKSSAAFVEALRNIPLLVLIIFMFLAVLQRLPAIAEAIEIPGLLVLSNRGVHVAWIETGEGARALLGVVLTGAVAAYVVGRWRTRRSDATGEPHHRVLWGAGVLLVVAAGGWATLGRPLAFSGPVLEGRLVQGGAEMSTAYGALLVSLTIYTAAFVAEIVRGSIQSVPRGQAEAANALGLTALQRLRFVILPQALRVAIPPAGNEFLNLTKNSSLGLAIAFPELLRVVSIAISQGNPAPQMITIMMGIYLAVSLLLSLLTNLANRALALKGA